MSESIVPQIDGVETRRTKILWANRYIQRGWPVFVLGHRKTPVKNCELCDTQLPGYVPHPMEDCPCLMCHGFYAATLDLDKVDDMLNRRPDGMLAVRTGGVRGAGGGLLVIDAESGADPRVEDGLTGLDVLDDWEGWTGFELARDDTLRQRTASGGLHVVYRIPDGVVVGSHNRVLPQVDVKATGGYVAVPDGSNGRKWETWGDPVTETPTVLLEWLQRTTGKTYGASGGRGGVGGRVRGALLSEADFVRAAREGARAGEREPFFAMASFRLFKQGMRPDIVRIELWKHWQRCEQPAGDEFPWSAVEYKITRDAQTVRPDPPTSDKLLQWVASFKSSGSGGGEGGGDATGDEPRRVGSVTLVPRSRRPL